MSAKTTCMQPRTAAAKTHALPDVAGRAAGYGIPGRRGRRQRVIAVYQAANAAVDRRAQAAARPDRVQDLPQRAHTSARAARSARPGERGAWLRKDPIALLERQLRDPGELDDSQAAEHRWRHHGRARERRRFRRGEPVPAARAGDRRRLFSLTQSKRDERSNAEDAEDTQRTRRRLSRAQRATITARGNGLLLRAGAMPSALCVPFASFALKRCFSPA